MTQDQPIGTIEPPRTAPPGKLRIAIVTPDILGPVKNGGVGTAYWEIATLLARAGHGVTIFFVPTTDTNVSEFEKWQRHYLNHGIALVPGKYPAVKLECQLPMQRSYAIYEQIRKYAFDLIHFPDMHGLGYYSFLAKKMGLAFQSTKLAVQVHGPNSWHRQFNEQDLLLHDEIFMDYMERKSLELADQVIISHSSICDWLKERDWKTSEDFSVLPLPCSYLDFKAAESPQKVYKQNEIVFFGRIETRKGVRTFCDALDLIARREEHPLRVTFLGKPGQVSTHDALDYIKERSAEWPFPIRLVTDLDRDSALAFLQEGKRIAVLPYRAETFGYALQECLGRQIPFIASGLSVFKDRVESEYHEKCFFDGSPEQLADRLRSALKNGLPPARLSVENASIEKQWVDWHAKLLEEKASKVSAKKRDMLVTVCISHRNRPEFLSQAIASITCQSYQNIEVIVSDDASDSPAATSYLETLERDFAPKGWKVLRHPSRSGPGACRNRAVAKARGEYVLLMDDDNVARPDEIATFVNAVQASKCDILTCFFDRTLDKNIKETPRVISRWLCLGDDLSAGFFHNVFGDMNCFVRRSAFTELGGINEAVDVGCEDWEFFARAVMAGFKLGVVPKALFIYRDHGESYTRKVDVFGSRLLPRSAFSRPAPKGSLTALMSYVASRIGFDLKPELPPKGVVVQAPIYGSISGGDLFSIDDSYKRVLFDLSDAKSRDRLIPLRQISFSKGDGHLVLECDGNDPGFEISGLELGDCERLLVEVEIDSSKETSFQLFFRSRQIPEYDERYSFRQSLNVGLNGFRFQLEHEGLLAPFRIDPADSDGTYLLKRLIIRSET